MRISSIVIYRRLSSRRPRRRCPRWPCAGRSTAADSKTRAAVHPPSAPATAVRPHHDRTSVPAAGNAGVRPRPLAAWRNATITALTRIRQLDAIIPPRSGRPWRASCLTPRHNPKSLRGWKQNPPSMSRTERVSSPTRPPSESRITRVDGRGWLVRPLARPELRHGAASTDPPTWSSGAFRRRERTGCGLPICLRQSTSPSPARRWPSPIERPMERSPRRRVHDPSQTRRVQLPTPSRRV